MSLPGLAQHAKTLLDPNANNERGTAVTASRLLGDGQDDAML